MLSCNGDTETLLLEENTLHARSDSSALFRALEKAVSLCGTPDALCVGLGPGFATTDSGPRSPPPARWPQHWNSLSMPSPPH